MVHKGDAAHNEINSFQSKAAKYKREGDAHFGKRNMREALASYGKAIEMSLSGTEEKAALFSNRAACYLMQNMYRHAINECSHALNEAPDFKPALLRRARAFEQLQQYDRAVSDLEAAAKADPNSDDVRKKLQATRAARDNRKASRSVSGLGGGGLRAPGKRGTQRLTPAQQQAAAAAASGQGQGQLPTLTIKATLVRGEAAETKNVVLPISVRYKDIVDQVRNLFPDDLKEQPFALKYKDAEGDLVTVTSRTDLRGALSAAMHHAEQRAAATGVQRPRDAGLAPVEVEVVPCAKAPSETPDQIIPDHVGSRDHPPNAEDEGAEDVIEIDEWLLTFAGLFRKHLGEDGAKEGPLDLRQIGLEKCCEALEVAVGTDKAKELLGAAADKFQEAAAAAIFNWGNVHVCASRKVVDCAAPAPEEGQPTPSDEQMAAAAKDHIKRIDDEYEKAVERYKQSLAIKSDFYEATIAWGQQCFERAKVYHFAAKAGDAAAAKEADVMFDLAEVKFQESLAMCPKEDEASTSGEGEAAAEQPGNLGLKAQIQVLWGNVLFERSQVRHHRGDDKWQVDTDAAVAKFNEAGCSKDDITKALMNHASGVWKDDEEAAKAKAGGK